MKEESTNVCDECEEEFTCLGETYGDGWHEPRMWEPDDDVCERCAEGRLFTITFKVVGWEDFSKLTDRKEWVDWFDPYDSVYLKTVEIKENE